MERATITIHLPSHRRESLKAYGESPRKVGEVYDERIGDYVEFVRRRGQECGFEIRTDNHDLDPVYQIDERDRDAKKAAHEWLRGLPDLWEWIT